MFTRLLTLYNLYNVCIQCGKAKKNSTYRFMIILTEAWWNPWMIQLIDTCPLNSSSNTIVCISNSLCGLHTQMVGKVIHLMYFTVSEHKCPNFQTLQASDGWNESILVYFTVFQLYVQISKFSRHQMDSICSCLDVFWSNIGYAILI